MSVKVFTYACKFTAETFSNVNRFYNCISSCKSIAGKIIAEITVTVNKDRRNFVTMNQLNNI